MPKTKLDIPPKTKPQISLEDAIASRLASEIVGELDISKLAPAVVKQVLVAAKSKFIDWLLDGGSVVAMTDLPMIEPEPEPEVQAA